MKRHFLALIVALAAAPPTRAGILTSGGTSFDTGTPTPTLTFSAPITLTITTTGVLSNLVFDGMGDQRRN